jgi:protein farnesyltransferase subunit beta
MSDSHYATGTTNESDRCRFLVESETSQLQTDTEDECAPFFVSLQDLPADQLLHLQQVGLLPPSSKQHANVVPLHSTRSAKARQLLGLDESSSEEEDVVVLEETLDVSVLSLEEKDTEASAEAEEETKADDSVYQVCLLREKHAAFVTRALFAPLPAGYVSLDSSRPWIIYWCLHSLDLLDRLPPGTKLQGVVHTLQACWTSTTVTLDTSLVQRDPFLSLHSNPNSDTPTTDMDSIWIPDASSSSSSSLFGREKIQLRGGGFGGGIGQMAHCAPGYAAVLALCIIAGLGLREKGEPSCDEETKEAAVMALALLKRKRLQLYVWFLSLRHTMPRLTTATPTTMTTENTMTGFRMHHDGEIDVRASYCILCMTTLLNLTTETLTEGVVEYIAACQTYEGGFGGEPHTEAHGGYTYCAVAALKLLNDYNHVDVQSLTGWLARRQMSYEGGFSGRCNKLVYGCYSFWQGAGMAVLDILYDKQQQQQHSSSEQTTGPHPFDSGMGEENDSSLMNEKAVTKRAGLLFDRTLLQRYILLCAQDVNGGLRDKPSKPRDFYHTCYNLSGLSIAQHVLSSHENNTSMEKNDDEDATRIYGNVETNLIGATHPCFNIRIERSTEILNVFHKKETQT